MKKLFIVISLVSIIVAGVFYLNNLDSFKKLLAEFNACSSPISYQIEKIDPRFGITKNDLIQLLEKTEKVWETPTAKNLFEYSETGNLRISLIYDSRQEATERLKKLGLSIDSSKASYDNLKALYTQKDNLYKQKLAYYQAMEAEFNTRKNQFEKNVQFWNTKGGAPKNEYEKLQNEQRKLNEVISNLNLLRNEVNDLAADLNALAGQLNRIANELNLNVNLYNTIGSNQGEEFQEGVYKSDLSGEHIEIYQFDSKSQLERVLAHELGHSLGLEHVEDKDAIMYRLNQSKNPTTTDSDLTELNRICNKPIKDRLIEFFRTR